ncbi:MAG: ABC transporter ATP-binding protein [Calditrichia bacterium]
MIRAKNLQFAYNGMSVLNNVSLTITSGESLSIIGPNGAGKSTLLKILARVLPLQSGSVQINGKPINLIPQKKFARIVGYVPQYFSTHFNFTAYEIVEMGRFPHQAFWRGGARDADLRAIQIAMEATETWDLRNRTIDRLSGGERQRVILASALAQEPEVLLLDEPTSALDFKHQVHFYHILGELQNDRTITIINVTHDVNMAVHFSQRIVVLKEGRIIADGHPQTILKKELIEELYGLQVRLISDPEKSIPIILPEAGRSI